MTTEKAPQQTAKVGAEITSRMVFLRKWSCLLCPPPRRRRTSHIHHPKPEKGNRGSTRKRNQPQQQLLLKNYNNQLVATDSMIEPIKATRDESTEDSAMVGLCPAKEKSSRGTDKEVAKPICSSHDTLVDHDESGPIWHGHLSSVETLLSDTLCHRFFKQRSFTVGSAEIDLWARSRLD